MLRIGELSRIAQVSCRLLRHYDALGLLRPGRVDADTGYRYYDVSQLTRLNRILVLRELGFSLEQIGPMLSAELGAAQLREMLRARRAELEREIAAQSARLELVDQRIEDLEDGGALRGDVVVRAEPATWFCGFRAPYASFDQAKGTVQSILRGMAAAPPPFELGRLFVVQHAPSFEPDELDLEIGFAIDADPQAPFARGEIVVGGVVLSPRLLPRHERIAAIVRVGPPEAAHRQSAAIAREMEARGYVLDGPNREVFLRNPGPGSTPIVEMQFPIRRGARYFTSTNR